MVKWCAYTVFERTRYRTPVAGYICCNTTISNHNKLYDTGNVTILTGNSEFLICLVQYLKTKQYNIVCIHDMSHSAVKHGLSSLGMRMRVSGMGAIGDPCTATISWSIVQSHLLYSASSPAPITKHSILVGWLVGSLRKLLQYVDVGGRVTRYDYEYESIW
jgi:hypothetical protein